ncbi:FAD-binding protein [Solimonas soli]|jgi:3-oxo-5alpha-steroid 4-dehydrogenase|uniref:FAD-binding protein n=1 Tax=Solimonas soli TaxID=413479 RepID=UPI0004896324|nr:FAD-binding protein [Solimonas soli]
MKPGDANWNSPVEPPLVLDDVERAQWSESADVVIVGFGAAGASAAIEARDAGAEVLAVDRFEGGGSTAISGGIYYGGATQVQRDAGYEDTPEEMYRYLKLETEGVVADETLMRFCRDSNDNLQWLQKQGVGFNSTLYKTKRSYPPNKYYLYFSGNELVAGYREHAKPAPRGHRVFGDGYTGGVLFKALKASALAKGVRLMTHAPASRLVLDRSGTVVGVEVRRIPPGAKAWKKHRRLINLVNAGLNYFEPVIQWAARKTAALEQNDGQRLLIRARRGVVLSTGSFAMNRPMVRHYAPNYAGAMALGSVGCDGAGIRLGQTAGGAVGEMERVSAWRSISPPTAFVKGVAVSSGGERFVSEDVYLGRMGERIAALPDRKALLIVDKPLYREAWKNVLPTFEKGWLPEWLSYGFTLLINLLTNTRKGKTLAELAQKCGIPAANLERTVAEYNAAVASGVDPLGKSAEYLDPLVDGPYYAIDISIDSKKYPCPSIPMGGLVVDEASGHVKREDGSRIAGLFAAGRNAVGICSRFYVSGTSIADCVFAGRRAGRSAAMEQALPVVAAARASVG